MKVLEWFVSASPNSQNMAKAKERDLQRQAARALNQLATMKERLKQERAHTFAEMKEAQSRKDELTARQLAEQIQGYDVRLVKLTMTSNRHEAWIFNEQLNSVQRELFSVAKMSADIGQVNRDDVMDTIQGMRESCDAAAEVRELFEAFAVEEDRLTRREAGTVSSVEDILQAGRAEVTKLAAHVPASPIEDGIDARIHEGLSRVERLLEQQPGKDSKG